jgi:hypothetical protein
LKLAHPGRRRHAILDEEDDVSRGWRYGLEDEDLRIWVLAG